MRAIRDLMCLVSLSASAALAGTIRPDDQATFRDQVAPLLTARCLNCHGSVAAKGGLSLANVAALLDGGDSGPAIEPGHPDDSLLIEKISGEKPEMPKGGQPLSPDEIALLKQWIEAGASWPDNLVLSEPKPDAGPWWAIQPIKLPAIPAVSVHSWPRTPIDAFILAALEAKGLQPRPEADRRTLIRRLCFDLTGLPPTPEDIDSFLNDPSPTAYESLVDRLLASPAYGERWARHWLDVAHYGDTHGYDKDKPRPNAWPYRDYVIKALNNDKPYGRFLQEQLAGDVLFPDDPAAIVATGFIAAGPWDLVGHVELREGTVDKLKTRLIDRDDMLASTMSTFASLTVHCARCHDHKFDPIPQKEYYRLQAVFAGVDRGDRPFPDAEAALRHADAEARPADLEQSRTRLRRTIAEQAGPELDAIDADLARLNQSRADLPRPANAPASSTNGYHSAVEPTAEATKWVQVDLGSRLPLDEIRLIPARPVDFPDTPGFGFPTRFRVEAADEPTFDRPTVLLDRTESDVPNPKNTWYVLRPAADPARYVRVTATKLWSRTNDFGFALGELQVLSDGRNVARNAPVTALDSIDAGRWSTRHLVDGFDSRSPTEGPEVAEYVHQVAALDLDIRRHEERRERLLADHTSPEHHAEANRLDREIEQAREALESRPDAPQVYALVSHDPRPITVLRRGDVEQPGEPVGPGALSCVSTLDPTFPETPDEGPRRAALAAWLSDPRNPLTWRSIVNRVWHYHFGRGLVDTPNDFGRNGSTPTHPELLDWLAADFRDHGQTLKRLHRLIVTSAVYRQQSAHDEPSARLDAENRLYWRQNRRRLEAEAIRDAALSVAGRLDPRMEGPGFALFRFKDDHSPIYDHDDPAWIDPPEGRRRSIYRFIVRSVPNPFVECLDGADPNAMVPVRNTTITALQALALLNDGFMIAQAEAFAQRISTLSDDPATQIDAAFTLALGRPPRPGERQRLTAYAARHGLPNACRVILNLNEFLFVD